MGSESAEERLKDRLFGLGPKRMLAIGGDGLRAAATLGLLSEIEARLVRRAGRRSFRLAEYFDFIGGAGVGGLIAAQLAIGRRVTQITEALRGLTPPPAPTGKGAKAAAGMRFDAQAMENLISAEFADRRLDAHGARTGLALFALPVGGGLRTLTNAPRPNAPAAPALADAVRASVAGPKLEDERAVSLPGVGDRFVDPALGGAGDPSMLLLEATTLPAHGIGWPTGPDQLLMISVGTASFDLKAQGQALFLAESRRRALVTIQALAQTPAPWAVGGELGDMRQAQLSPVPMLHFVRFDARVNAAELAALKLEFAPPEVALLSEPAPQDAAGLARLHEVGLRAARALFDIGGDPNRSRERDVFPQRFDPPGFGLRGVGPPRTRLEALGRTFERPILEDEDED